MSKDKKVILQRKRLAAIFASFSILAVGTLSLLESMSLDYYSVLDTVGKIIPASIVMGGLGWVMGMILDKPKSRHPIATNLYLNDVINNSIASEEDLSTITKPID